MPLMSPDIQALMRKAGLEQSKEDVDETTRSLKDELEDAGLGLKTILENLAGMTCSANEALRMKANETVLKMHGVLKESAAGGGPQMPTFVLNIINGESSESVNIPTGVNPIFLPRQLHNQLKEENKTTN